MAIILGTPTNSGNLSNSAGTTLSHTNPTGTKAVVAIITGYDSSATDSAVTGVTYNSVNLSQGRYYRSGSGFIAIWYLEKPAIGTFNMVVTMGGACTDLQVTAVPLLSNTSPVITLDFYAESTTTNTTTHPLTINPAKAGAVALGGIVDLQAAITNLSVTVGSEITGSEADMGSQVVGCAASALESGGSVDITWTKSALATSYALMCSFYEQFSPSVALNNPADLATGVGLTPTLQFTGTDTAGDAIEYEIQVDTINSFLSQQSSGGDFSLKYIDLIAGKVNLPTDNVTVEVYTGLNGTLLGTSEPVNASTFSYPGVNTVRFTFTTPIGITGMSDYYFRVKREVSHTSNYVYFATNTTYALGTSYLNNWLTRDFAFGLYDTSSVLMVDNLTNNADWILLNFSTDNCGQSFKGLTLANPLLAKLSTTDTGFSTGHPFASGTQQSYTLQSPLTGSATYYWRVRAIDPLGSGIWGNWSTTRSFTTQASTNQSPTLSLNSPDDGATVTDSTPTFEFTGSDSDSDTLEYHIQVDSVNTFAGGSNWWALTPLTQSGSITGILDSYGLLFSPDGLHMYIPHQDNHTITQWNLTSPWDINSATVTAKVLNTASYSPQPEGMWMNGDGTMILVFSAQNFTWRSYTLSTAYDIDTASYTGEKLTMGTGKFHSCAVSPDGTRMIIATRDNLDRTLYQYNLSTPWNLDTATQSGTLDVSTYTYTVLSVWVNALGTNMYINSPTLDNLVRYTLSTPWNLSTATFHSQMTMDFATQYSVTTFTPDGRRIYQNTNTSVVQYDFQTSLLVNADSTTGQGFENLVVPGNTHPFTAGQRIGYTPPVNLEQGTYYWRVRVKDPQGTNTWTAWSSIRSLTLSAVTGSLVKAVNSLARSSVKAINSLVTAMVKKINGLE